MSAKCQKRTSRKNASVHRPQLRRRRCALQEGAKVAFAGQRLAVEGTQREDLNELDGHLVVLGAPAVNALLSTGIYFVARWIVS